MHPTASVRWGFDSDSRGLLSRRILRGEVGFKRVVVVRSWEWIDPIGRLSASDSCAAGRELLPLDLDVDNRHEDRQARSIRIGADDFATGD